MGVSFDGLPPSWTRNFLSFESPAPLPGLWGRGVLGGCPRPMRTPEGRDGSFPLWLFAPSLGALKTTALRQEGPLISEWRTSEGPEYGEFGVGWGWGRHLSLPSPLGSQALDSPGACVCPPRLLLPSPLVFISDSPTPGLEAARLSRHSPLSSTSCFFLFSSPTSKRVFSETPSLPQNLRCLVAALRGRGGPQFLVDPSGNRLQVLQDSIGNEGMRRLTQGQTGLQILPLLCNRGRDTSC